MGLVSLAGALSVPAAADAASKPAATSGSTNGTVASVDASAQTFEVKTSSGTVEVKVTGSTTYRESSVSKPTFADVKVGDSVAVIGTTSAGVVTATIVILASPTGSGSSGGGFGGFPGGGFGGRTFGTVTSVDASADTFEVKTVSGSTVKVEVTKSTTYRDNAVSKASFADVKKGATVAVAGSTSNGVETATSVTIGRFGLGGGPVGAFGGGTFGTVTSVDASADTFEVKTASGSTVKVKVTKSTTYRDNAVSKASFADVKKGTTVAVLGSTSKGVETATSVVIGRLGAGFGGAPSGASGLRPGTSGTVTSVDRSADTFEVKTASGSRVKVKVTKSTTYRDFSAQSAGFSDVKVGASVAVVGKTSGGVETATSVFIGGGGAGPAA